MCSKAMFRHNDNIPDEDFMFYFLYEGMGAFLPISIGPFINKWET